MKTETTKKFRFFLPSVSILPLIWRRGWGVRSAIREAKIAGYDGVEIHLLGGVRVTPHRYYRLARELGLGVTWHEGWSPGQSSSFKKVYRLYERLGYLPKDGTPFEEMVRQDLRSEPVVVYGNELVDNPDKLLENHHLQTMSVFTNGWFKVRFDDFLYRFNSQPRKVVFDTYHYLEWFTQRSNPLEYYTREELSGMLIEGFDSLADHITEIHLADCGRGGWEEGRNPMLGEGLIPLDEFGGHVDQSGWQGIVTPEVDPTHLVTWVHRVPGRGLVVCTRSANIALTLKKAKEMMRC